MSLRSLCKELVFALREAFVLGEGAGRGAGRHRLQSRVLSPLSSRSPGVPTRGYSHIPGVSLGLFPHSLGLLSPAALQDCDLGFAAHPWVPCPRGFTLGTESPALGQTPHGSLPATSHLPGLTQTSLRVIINPRSTQIPSRGLGTLGKPPQNVWGVQAQGSLVCREMLTRTSFLQGEGFIIHLYKFLAYFSGDVECIYLVFEVDKMGELVWQSLGRGTGFAPNLCVRLNGEMALFRAALAARLCGAKFVQEKHLSMVLVEKDGGARAISWFSSIRKHSWVRSGFRFCL